MKKIDYSAYEDVVDHERLLEEKMKEDLKYEKGHEDCLYKMLKYNPIDLINDEYRKLVERYDVEFTEQRLQWRLANFYVKFIGRLLWNFKAEYPNKNMFPEYGPGIVVSNHQTPRLVRRRMTRSRNATYGAKTAGEKPIPSWPVRPFQRPSRY